MSFIAGFAEHNLQYYFECSLSNNEAEYEVVLNAIHMLVAMKAEDVMIFSDSQFVAQQVLGNFEIKD